MYVFESSCLPTLHPDRYSNIEMVGLDVVRILPLQYNFNEKIGTALKFLDDLPNELVRNFCALRISKHCIGFTEIFYFERSEYCKHKE